MGFFRHCELAGQVPTSVVVAGIWKGAREPSWYRISVVLVAKASGSCWQPASVISPLASGLHRRYESARNTKGFREKVDGAGAGAGRTATGVVDVERELGLDN